MCLIKKYSSSDNDEPLKLFDCDTVQFQDALSLLQQSFKFARISTTHIQRLDVISEVHAIAAVGVRFDSGYRVKVDDG